MNLYYVYITTNPGRTVLYIGVTNDLKRRLSEHCLNVWENPKSFSGKYFCYNLVYFEQFEDVNYAIARETELKKWSREKKKALIEKRNPDWIFLNDKI